MKNERDDSGVRFPPPLVYLGFVMLGLLIDRFGGLPALGMEQDWRQGLGIALGATGIILVGAALNRFVNAGTAPEPWRPTTAIVERGIYRWSRNPMYLGMATISLAAAILLDSVGAMVMTAAAVVAIDRIVIAREERYLATKFGDPYRAYCSRVRRWI